MMVRIFLGVLGDRIKTGFEALLCPVRTGLEAHSVVLSVSLSRAAGGLAGARFAL